MKTTINFRTDKDQKVNLPFEGEVTVKFVGVCPLTGERLYVSSGGNDPRGPLGRHAVHEYVAEEYGMQGPTLCVSWIAANNSSTMYEQGLRLAKKNWK